MDYKSGIYMISNPKGRFYVGQSLYLEGRKKTYENLNCKTQTKLYRSLLKYGWENHGYMILEHCEEEKLNNKERFYQDTYDCLKKGLNCRLTKSDDKSGYMSDESKKKMSLSCTGRKHTDESKAKMSISKKGHIPWTKGKKMSIETRKKNQKAAKGNTNMKGKKHSDETKQKISNSKKGKTSNRKGIKLSDETKKRMSDSKKKLSKSI